MSKASRILELERELWGSKWDLKLLREQLALCTRPFSIVEVQGFYGAGLITKLEARKLIGIDK